MKDQKFYGGLLVLMSAPAVDVYWLHCVTRETVSDFGRAYRLYRG